MGKIIVATTIMAVAEALTLARKSGIDVAKVRQALLGGFAQSRILTALVHEAMASMIAQGHGDVDHSALARFVEALAGAKT